MVGKKIRILILQCIGWNVDDTNSSCRLSHALLMIVRVCFGSRFSNVMTALMNAIMCLGISSLKGLCLIIRGLKCYGVVTLAVLFDLSLNPRVALTSLLVVTNYGLFCPLKMTRLFESFILVCYLSEYYSFYYCLKSPEDLRHNHLY